MLLSNLFGAGFSASAMGFTLLVSIGGAQLAAIGVVGFYVSRTYNQVRNRPEYLIESTHGFPESNVVSLRDSRGGLGGGG